MSTQDNAVPSQAELLSLVAELQAKLAQAEKAKSAPSSDPSEKLVAVLADPKRNYLRSKMFKNIVWAQLSFTAETTVGEYQAAFQAFTAKYDAAKKAGKDSKAATQAALAK